MKKPFFSIVMPTYNRLYSLKKTFLPSLELQGEVDYELIVIDDNSNDGTDKYFEKNFVEEFPKCSKKYVYFKNETNGGSAYSRNVGVSISNGEWIFIVEDDLYLPNNFLLKGKEFIEKYGEEFKIITPMRKERTAGYYNDCFNGYIKIGLISKEIYLNSLYPKVVKGLSTTQMCSFIHRSIYDHCRYIPDFPDKRFAFREEDCFYYSATRSGIFAKILYLGKKLSMEHRNDISAQGGGNRLEGMNLIRKELTYISGHYNFLKRFYSLPEIRIIFFILVRSLKLAANILKIKGIKKALAIIGM